MNATYWQKGDTIDYMASVPVAAGEVVGLNTRIGVAGADIGQGETGAVHVTGVFFLPKAGVAVDLGTAVYFDVAEDRVTTEQDGNIPVGYAAAPAAAGDATLPVKLLG